MKMTMAMMRSKPRVAVGMSGGVDSSVTVARLLEQGYDVTGVTLDLLPKWAAPEGENTAIRDAKRVAEKLGIQHYVLREQDFFEREVMLPFSESYAQGFTPNPCVNCNVKVKFGLLLEYARSLGCEYLATGHYARLVQRDGQTYLSRPKDARKDQTYFLWRVDPALLDSVLFPLADMCKTETFRLAEELGLEVAHKPESQDICFTCKLDHGEIVKHQCAEATQPGNIIDEQGNVRGTHSGLYQYTIGQRKGLGVGGLEKPYYVYKIDPVTNTVHIGPRELLEVSHIMASDAYMRLATLGEEISCKVMLRYNMKPAEALVKLNEDHTLSIDLKEPAYGIACGQSAVCYREIDGNDIVIGGGIISCVD